MGKEGAFQLPEQSLVQPLLNRRKDIAVRDAIRSIQTLLFDPDAHKKVFDILLTQILRISEGDIGVVYLQANSLAISDANLVDDDNWVECACIAGPLRQEFNKHTLIHMMKGNTEQKTPLVFNGPFAPDAQALLDQSASVAGTIVLPIISRNRLVGACALASGSRRYGMEDARRLIPMIGASVCALQSAESSRKLKGTLGEKVFKDGFLSAFIANSPTAILIVNDERVIELSNQTAETLFGGEKLNGLPIQRLIVNYSQLFEWSNQVDRYGMLAKKNEPSSQWSKQQVKRLDGNFVTVDFTVFRIQYLGRRYTTFQIQPVRSKQRVAQPSYAQQQLSVLTHLIPVGILRVDREWRCLFSNDRWCELSGLNVSESTNNGWINAFHREEVSLVLTELQLAMQDGREYQRECRLVSPLGLVLWVDFHARPLFDEDTQTTGFLATFADVTEARVQQEKLKRVAEYDELTGLANRHLLQARLHEVLNKGEVGQQSVLLFLDLDGFKDINDTFGHEMGDNLLKEVGARLQRCVRASDTVARFGGDEFVLLFPNVTPEFDTQSMAEKAIHSIALPYLIGGNKLFVTTSVGIAVGRAQTCTPEQLLKEADTALYAAKSEGKNNAQYFNDALNHAATERLKMIHLLRRNVEEETFFLEYQAQACIKTRRMKGFEALLRMRGENGEVIYPSDFISLLEETGLIIEVGRRLVREVCGHIRDWQKLGVWDPELCVALNFSPKQLLDASTVQCVAETCAEFGLNPSVFIIEVTESVLIDKPNCVATVMNGLKALGVSLSLDDFGTGYSSLSYLQRYPFDQLKIDKSFVDGLLTDQGDVEITKATIALAHALGISVTAEGVASEKVLDLLAELGADHYQGFFLGKPTHKDAVTELLRSKLH